MVSATDFIGRFRTAFPGAGSPRICRAPGRVNLLGEHLDYNGLPVLPMAIDRCIHVAYAPLDAPVVAIANRDSRFPADSFAADAPIVPSPDAAWTNYVKAAFIAAQPERDATTAHGAALYFDSDLPPASGLSSSTALVVAAAMAFLDIYGAGPGNPKERLALAERLARGERFLGTEGGAMDHAIILAAQAHHAAKIDFDPIRIEQVPLFDDHVFIVAHSREEAAKASDGGHAYNSGPRLCAIVRAFLERAAREMFDEEVELPRLADLWLGPLCLTHAEAGEVFKAAFPEERYTTLAIANKLQVSEPEVCELLPSLPEPANGWPLRARARHVFSEYERVELGRDALLSGDPVLFGSLMTASHKSCAIDMGVSTPALDQLVKCAVEAGALGARLTGAGGGGCAIALVPSDEADAALERIDASFYKGDAANSELFAVANEGGAAYLSC